MAGVLLTGPRTCGLDPAKSKGGEVAVDLVFPDRKERFRLRVKHNVLTYEADPAGGAADGVFALPRAQFLAGALAGADLSGQATAGDKTAIDLLELASGQRQRLAERPRPGESGTAGLGWRFDPAVLDRGNALLEKLPPGELLLIDELGPLEFRGEGGFIAGFAAIDARHYRLAVVVVRPELLDAARQRWPWYSAVAEMRMP